MADEVIWTLTIDGAEALATLDELDAGMQALDEQINQVASVSGGLTSLDDILTALQGVTDAVSNGFTDLDMTLNQVVASTDAVEAAVVGLETSLEGIASGEQAAAAGADETATSFDLLAAASDAASAAMDALNAATGPLTMITAVAGMAGKQMFDMGVQAQNGFNLVQNMAGASDADMQKLEQTSLQLGVNLQESSSGFYMVESAGYSGAGGINVFKYAEEAALASGAGARDEMTGLTAIMHDYSAKASEAGKYTDQMTEAIILGKQSASDFARNIGPLANMGHQTGLSFQEVAAAESTLTQVNPKVAQDGMQLQGLFQALSPTMGTVVQSAKKLGLEFNQTHFESLTLAGKLEYLAQIAGGTNTAAFVKLTGGVRGSHAAMALMADGGKTLTSNLDKISHSAGTTDQAFAKFKNSVQGHLDDLNAEISDFSKHFVDALGPKITPILDQISHGIGQFTDFAKTHMDQLMPVFAGLAALLGGAVIGAIAGLIVTIGPVLGILLALGAVVAGVVYAFQHWGDIMKQVNAVLQIPAIHVIVQLLQGAAAFLVSSFTPVWQQLVNVFNSQIKPAFTQLWSTIQQIMPELKMLGIFIGAVLVISFGVLVAVIGGVVRAFAGLLSGIATAIGGIITIFTGIVQIVSGIVALIVDICTGNFSKLGADLGMIWRGIVNIFTGIWQVIVGLFQAAIGVIGGLVSGFIDSIIGYFTSLYNDLVGHSIIPDMINGIVDWISQLPGRALAFIMNLYTMAVAAFNLLMSAAILLISNMVNNIVSTISSLPGRAMSFISSLVSQIQSTLGGLGSQALGWAQDMISNFVSGIENGIGQVGNAASSIGKSIWDHLHFSKPEIGPLADADQWMPDFGNMLSQGLNEQVAKVKASSLKVAAVIQTAVTPVTQQPATTATTVGASTLPNNNNNAQMITLLSQILLVLQQQQRGTLNNNLVMNNTINAPTINPQQLYNQMQNMGGTDYQWLQRGAFGL